jgi:hypothetical protein
MLRSQRLMIGEKSWVKPRGQVTRSAAEVYEQFFVPLAVQRDWLQLDCALSYGPA